MTESLIFSCRLASKSSLAPIYQQISLAWEDAPPADFSRARSACFDGEESNSRWEKLGSLLPIVPLVCEQTTLVSEFADPPSLSPAVLKEPWCCCETLTNDQFEAVAGDQGTCEWMGLIPLLSSHILGVWLSVPLEEELQESIWFSYRRFCVCMYVYVVCLSYVFNFYRYL